MLSIVSFGRRVKGCFMSASSNVGDTCILFLVDVIMCCTHNVVKQNSGSHVVEW